MSELAELERLQTQILHRIAKLELSILPSNNSPNKDLPTTTEARLSALLFDAGVKDFSFKRVPSDYYDWSFEARRDILGAASIHHLCKSIVLVLLIWPIPFVLTVLCFWCFRKVECVIFCEFNWFMFEFLIGYVINRMCLSQILHRFAIFTFNAKQFAEKSLLDIGIWTYSL